MNSLEMNNIEEIKTLNPYQQEAVLDESPACLVNANVGSGKTTVLIEKVRHLHEKKQVSYEKMAVLTFTNKAAGQMRSQNVYPEKKQSLRKKNCGDLEPFTVLP